MSTSKHGICVINETISFPFDNIRTETLSNGTNEIYLSISELNIDEKIYIEKGLSKELYAFVNNTNRVIKNIKAYNFNNKIIMSENSFFNMVACGFNYNVREDNWYFLVKLTQ